jgi:hypothetical protein
VDHAEVGDATPGHGSASSWCSFVRVGVAAADWGRLVARLRRPPCFRLPDQATGSGKTRRLMRRVYLFFPIQVASPWLYHPQRFILHRDISAKLIATGSALRGP